MEYETLIQRALEQIDGALSERLSIGALARDAYFSPYHFQRIFRAQVGDPVMEYVRKRRLSLAGRELCETGRSILDIALEYGYGSAEGFARAFKAFHGRTPTECRRSHVYRSYGNHFRERMGFMKPNVEGMLSPFDELAAQADAVAVESQQVGLGNYGVIGEELRFLAGRLRSCGEEGRRRMEQARESFAAINLALDMIKAMEDAVFQLHILAFFTGIETARTGENEAAGRMGSQCAQLARAGEALCGRVVEAAQLSALIDEDIRRQMQERRQLIASAGRSGAADVARAAGQIRSVSGELPDGSFPVIADALDAIAARLTQRAEDFDGAAAGGEQAEDEKARQLSRSLEDEAFLTNVLCLEAKLTRERTPQVVQTSALAQMLLDLPRQLAERWKECEEARVELRSLSGLAGRGAPQGKDGRDERKRMEDAAFQGTVMLFAVREEAAKIEGSLGQRPDEEVMRLAAQLEAELRELPSGGGAAGAAGTLERLEGELSAWGERLGEKGDVLCYLSAELAHLRRALQG